MNANGSPSRSTRIYRRAEPTAVDLKLRRCELPLRPPTLSRKRSAGLAGRRFPFRRNRRQLGSASEFANASPNPISTRGEDEDEAARPGPSTRSSRSNLMCLMSQRSTLLVPRSTWKNEQRPAAAVETRSVRVEATASRESNDRAARTESVPRPPRSTPWSRTDQGRRLAKKHVNVRPNETLRRAAALERPSL